MLLNMHFSDSLSWLSNNNEAGSATAEVRDLRQRYFTSAFPKLAW
jgi:hypothetical protein